MTERSAHSVAIYANNDHLQKNSHPMSLGANLQQPTCRSTGWTRIAACSPSHLQDTDIGDDPLATFLAFQALLDTQDAQVWPIWQEFKKLAQTLEDWHYDRTLYHLVGFLVATAIDDKTSGGLTRQAEASVLLHLVKARMSSTGTGFDRHLRRLAWRRFVGPHAEGPPTDGFTKNDLAQRIEERIEALNYGSDPVGAVLLLFNVATLLDQTASTQRFQFDGYKQNSWDIEHVRSVAEYIPRAAADRRRWLERARDFVVTPFATERDLTLSENLRQDIEALLAAPSPDEGTFTQVFNGVRALSGEAEARADDNALSNLVLLDMVTNRSYKNAIFPVKRTRIIDLDKRGQFLPPATRNVFLKYYSQEASQLMLWDRADQEAYGVAIEETLLRFFEPLMRKEGVK